MDLPISPAHRVRLVMEGKRAAGLSLLAAVLAVQPCAASEGMLYLALYYCNANAANEAVVSACSETHPGLATQARDALESWRASYGAKAQRASAECAKKLSDAEPKAFHAEALRRWMTDLETRAKEPNDAFCRLAITKIGDMTEDKDMWK